MNETITKSCDLSKSEMDGQSVYTFVISTEMIDRDGEIMSADGAIFDAYLKSPVVLMNHDRNIVVGKTIQIRREDGRILADMVFAETEEAQKVKKLVDGGFLTSGSIKFEPIEKPIYGGPNDGFFRKFTKWELWEWSIVSVPANPEAVRLKSGRVLAKRNLERINKIKAMCDELIAEMAEEDPEEPKSAGDRPAEGGKQAEGLRIQGLTIII